MQELEKRYEGKLRIQTVVSRKRQRGRSPDGYRH